MGTNGHTWLARVSQGEKRKHQRGPRKTCEEYSHLEGWKEEKAWKRGQWACQQNPTPIRRNTQRGPLTADRDTSTLWNMNDVSERMSSSRLRPYSSKKVKLATWGQSPTQHCDIVQSLLSSLRPACVLKQLLTRLPTSHTAGFQKLNSGKMVKICLACHSNGNKMFLFSKMGGEEGWACNPHSSYCPGVCSECGFQWRREQ